MSQNKRTDLCTKRAAMLTFVSSNVRHLTCVSKMDVLFRELLSYALIHVNDPDILQRLAHMYQHVRKGHTLLRFYNTASVLDVSFRDVQEAYSVTHRLLDAVCMIDHDSTDVQRICQVAEKYCRPRGYWRLWSPTISDVASRGYICVS